MDIQQTQMFKNNKVMSVSFMVTEKNISGETAVVLNTSGYSAGMYTAKFTTRKGESFSRKFIVTK